MRLVYLFVSTTNMFYLGVLVDDELQAEASDLTAVASLLPFIIIH